MASRLTSPAPVGCAEFHSSRTAHSADDARSCGPTSSGWSASRSVNSESSISKASIQSNSGGLTRIGTASSPAAVGLPTKESEAIVSSADGMAQGSSSPSCGLVGSAKSSAFQIAECFKSFVVSHRPGPQWRAQTSASGPEASALRWRYYTNGSNLYSVSPEKPSGLMEGGVKTPVDCALDGQPLGIGHAKARLAGLQKPRSRLALLDRSIPCPGGAPAYHWPLCSPSWRTWYASKFAAGVGN